MASQTPRAVLWDVMDTLVYDPFHVVIPAFLGLSFQELLETKHPRAWVDFELGATDEETMFSRFFRDRRPFDRAGLKAAMVDAYRWLDGMESLVAELAATGLPMVALSNYPVYYRLIEDKLGLSRYVDWRFVSCRTGLRKPDPRAYLGAADTLGLNPDQLLFIDDREGNCEGARAVGMAAIRFRDADALRAELAGRGLDV
ncbi:MAG: HAD family phosphatase [Deltaproteobacteria bacterium]|nr:HAD family phosphatase [Deltaproteobacteria bacterium]